jgi:transposase
MDATAVTTDTRVAVDTLGRRIMPRRFRPLAEKRRIAQEALLPGVSVAEIARRHGINANLVFGWRRMEQMGLLGARPRRAHPLLLPVKVIEPPATATTPGTLRIEFAGGIELHITGAVDAALVERIIAQIQR